MSLRYKGIFTNYQQPFVVTYLGASLMVVYLPVAFFKDWLQKVLNRKSAKGGKGSENNKESCDGFNSPLNRKIVEMELHGAWTKKDSDLALSLQDEDKPLVLRGKDELNVLRNEKELNNRQVAKCGFYIAPLWFVTEVFVGFVIANLSDRLSKPLGL